MTKVLFICHGNICRSTMAQYVFEDMVKKQGIADLFEIDSAATSREEIGNGVHHGTRHKLTEMGIPCGNHRARQVTKADYEYFDYLIIMDANNRRNVMRIIGSDPEHKVHGLLDFSEQPRDIADPWYTGNFDVTYEGYCRGVYGFSEIYRSRKPINKFIDYHSKCKSILSTSIKERNALPLFYTSYALCLTFPA